MSKIGQVWQKLSAFGLHQGLEEHEIIKIRLMNRLSTISIIVSLVLFFSDMVILMRIRIMNLAVALFISGMVYYLHHIKWYNVPRYLASFFYPLWISFLALYGGDTYGENIVYLLLVFLTMILFQYQIKTKVLAVIWIISIAIVTRICMHEWYPEIMQFVNPNNNILVFIASTLILILIINIYQSDIIQFNNIKESLIQNLHQKNDELKQFNYITSHDLNEPLQKMDAFSGLLLKHYGNQLDERGKKSLEYIHESSQRMRNMIHGLMEYSLLGQNGQKEALDLEKIIMDVQVSLKDKIIDSKASISYEELPIIHGFKHEIQLLFLHLIKNAIQFRRENETPTIIIEAEDAHNGWDIRISDNARGFSHTDQKHIFQLFHKKANDEHVGMGLAYCRKIVELHQGSIQLESKPGMGSQFTIHIPRP